MSRSRFSFSVAGAVSILTFAALGSQSAAAADLDPALEDAPQIMPVSNVVFGSGWYVRGDFGGARLLQANPFNPGQLSVASITTSQAIERGPRIEDSHRFGYVADLGAGYSFNPWFRADVVADFNEPVNSSVYGPSFQCQTGYRKVTFQPRFGGCNGTFQADLQSYDVLLNGYIDLGTYYNIVTPYVGGGVGLSFGHDDTQSHFYDGRGAYAITVTNPRTSRSTALNFDSSTSAQYYKPAFALMAGLAFQVYDHTKIDIGYRYLNLGTVLGTTIQKQEVRAGLRYMIDN